MSRSQVKQRMMIKSSHLINRYPETRSRVKHRVLRSLDFFYLMTRLLLVTPIRVLNRPNKLSRRSHHKVAKVISSKLTKKEIWRQRKVQLLLLKKRARIKRQKIRKSRRTMTQKRHPRRNRPQRQMISLQIRRKILRSLELKGRPIRRRCPASTRRMMVHQVNRLNLKVKRLRRKTLKAQIRNRRRPNLRPPPSLAASQLLQSPLRLLPSRLMREMLKLLKARKRARSQAQQRTRHLRTLIQRTVKAQKKRVRRVRRLLVPKIRSQSQQAVTLKRKKEARAARQLSPSHPIHHQNLLSMSVTRARKKRALRKRTIKRKKIQSRRR